MLKVRHISISEQKPYVAFGAFERQVEVWNYQSGKRVSAFDTILSYGGQRLAISKDGDRVLAAAWARHGLACYDAHTGKLIWQRRDLKKVQRINLSRDGASAFCGIESRSCLGIAVSSGEELCSFRGAKSRVESSYSEFAVIDRTRPEVVGPNGRRGFKIERTTFAVLAWAIGSETLLISEAGGPVRCFELSSGEELWRYKPPIGTHYIDLAYSEALAQFLGVCWPYEYGGAKELAWFPPQGKQPEELHDLGNPAETAFSPDGGILISSTGEIFDTQRGAVVEMIPVEHGIMFH